MLDRVEALFKFHAGKILEAGRELRGGDSSNAVSASERTSATEVGDGHRGGCLGQ